MTAATELQNTSVTALTPPGRGAIAVVVVEGPGAIAAVEQLFHSSTGRHLSSVPPKRILFGHWATAFGEEVVACKHSEQLVEIHCHGGIIASAEIVNSLTDLGCTAIDPLSHLEAVEQDLIKREATAALANAVTERAALILLDQYQGALSAAFQRIESLISERNFMLARKEIETLLQRASTGLHLTKPWQVVLAGRPNVGKSSLINALVGYERAIVFDTPGTTRDVVTATTAFEGWAVELSDTAGQREATDAIEAAGVAKAREQCEAADLVVLVLDASIPTVEDDSLQAQYPSALIVWNKADLVSGDALPASGLAVSATTGEGLNKLVENIVHRIVDIELPPHAAVPFTTAQIHHLQALLAKTVE